jgi:RNA polymerase sigma factor (sigma-70 family)
MPRLDLGLDESVTAWVERLRTGDREAGDLLHDRYREFLLSVARKQYRNALAAASDEEDLVQSVFHDLWKAASLGRLGPVEDRESFWWLLLTIARNKAVSRIRAARTRKRGAGEPVQFSQIGDSREGRLGYADMAATAVNELVIEFMEEQERLFAMLRDDVERTIVAGRLEGQSPVEIAGRLGVTVRTVERKVRIIREKWQRYQESVDGGLTHHDSAAG